MIRKRGFRPVNFVFGLAMGAADVVPGISGGTMALILGFYQRLITSIRAAAIAGTEALRGRRAAARIAFGQVEWGLVLPLGVGVVVALIVGARVIEPLMHAYPVHVRALFFGLILASIPIPWRAVSEPTQKHYTIAALAAVTAFFVTGFPPREVVNPPLILVFATAMIAICAMILPGISGAFLLVVMGMYTPALEALNGRDFTYVAVFAVGALIGLGAFSKVLFYLLHEHHDVTLSVLVGFMTGSLRALWPYQDETRSLLAPPSVVSLLISVGLAAIGFTVVVLLNRMGRRAGTLSLRAAQQAGRR
jgi:putative membrane protein